MTSFADERPHRGIASASKTFTPNRITAVTVLFAAVLASLMFWPRLQEVWRHGAFYDSDDAMRLVEVRALLAGQGWFDMTAYGLDPPQGASMHWSRVVDVPLALLIKAFGIFADHATSEALARLVFPFALLLGLFAGVARLGDALLGSHARIPAMITALLCGCAVVQFQPGRIDHHAPQIVTLVFMVGAALAALDPAKARRAALAGVLVAVSLAISLENLPFIVTLAGMLVAIWCWQGGAADRMLRCFGFGLGVGLTVTFAATVSPSLWLGPVCDAFGAAHLGAGLIGAGGCIALSATSRHLKTLLHRMVAAAAVAGLVLFYVATAYPACLHDPFAAVDPLVRTIWISNVTESWPLTRFFRENRSGALLSVLPVVMGLGGCLVAAATFRGTTALRFLVLSGLSAAGLAMTFWQIRVFTSVTPLAVCGALPLAIVVHDRMRREGRDAMALLGLCLVFPFTSLAWALALPDDPPGQAHASTCLAPQSFAPLATLPPGAVVAPIDAGSFLLIHTPLTAFAAPYHRNNDGNRFALETYLATPERAVAGLVTRGASYLMICPGLGETARLAERAPDSLAAALLAGKIPNGLIAVPIAGTPYKVFKVSYVKS